MKVLYSPEFTGHVFVGLNEENSQMMDTAVCDTMGLIGQLEMLLGIHVDEHPAHYRTAKYFEALSKYMKEHPDNALAASFKLSGLGTAEQALRWRDSLMLDKWKADEATACSGRLKVLAGTEQYFDAPGLPDRLKNVLSYIDKVDSSFFKDLEIVAPCSVRMLHPAIQELLFTAERHGATLTAERWNRNDSVCNRFAADSISVNGKTIYADDLGGKIAKSQDTGEPVEPLEGKNLMHLSHLLQSALGVKVKLNKGDRSFLIYKFADEKAANEYMALKGEELGADVWINSDNKSMDNWLRMMGKPTMGSTMAASMPQLTQLFLLGIEMMKEPLSIQSMISWLYAPMQPLGTFFGGLLADTIIDEGGFRNEKCRKLVESYVEGKYTYHDKEEDAKLSEKELERRNKKEKEERQQLVNTYLPPFEPSEENGIDVCRMNAYLNSLSGWARSRARYLQRKPGNEGWCGQLASLAQMCDTFILLVASSGIQKYLDNKQVESWLSTLYKGDAFMQYIPQRGSWELIDSPAKMAAQSKRTVWMNFAGSEVNHLDCSFLYPTEKDAVCKDLVMWEEYREIDFHKQMMQLPFYKTQEQLIVVVTDYTGGEPTVKHPIMVQLESVIENLEDFIVTPGLEKEKAVKVPLVGNNNTKAQIEFEHADLLKWPGYMSPTSISTLVEYPLDFMMERMLNIVSTGPGSIKDIKATTGTVAHAVIEGLFAPRDGKFYSKADEIEQRINREFDEQLHKSIEACGAILYLPENRLETELLKKQLRRCLDILLKIITENHLTVTGCEQRVKKDMGLIRNDKGWDMIGYIDMTLEDEDHHPVVFDFKWTSSKSYYRDLLLANRSIQLELYRVMLGAEKRDEVKRTAYFLMPEGHLYSKEHFEGLHCTQLHPGNFDNVVEQIRKSFFYRKKQMDAGTVEVGDNFNLDSLDYYNDTESMDLFPLKGVGDLKDINKFSKYDLFK